MDATVLVLVLVVLLPYAYVLSRVVFWAYFAAKRNYQLSLIQQFGNPHGRQK